MLLVCHCVIFRPLCSVISINSRHSYFIISGLFIFVHFRIIPSCYQFASRSIISGYSITSGNISEVFCLLCSVISGTFRHSYYIISGFFGRPPVLAGRAEIDPGLFSLETETQQYVLLGTIHSRAFPKNSVLLPFRFTVNFRHSYFIISGLFRRPPVLAGQPENVPGLFSLETETQQYVLLGISLQSPSVPFGYFCKFPSFVCHHFRIIHILAFPKYSVLLPCRLTVHISVWSFPQISVVDNSSYPIIHICGFSNNSVLLPFRLTVHHFRKFPSFMIHHIRSIHICLFSNSSGLLPFRFRAHHFRKLPSFIVYHFRIIHCSYSCISE